MSHMQVCMRCPHVYEELTPTDIYTLLERRPDPNQHFTVTQFLEAATPIIAKIPANGGNDGSHNAREFYSALASMVATYTSIVAELAEPGQSDQKSVHDLRRMRSDQDLQIRMFETYMNIPSYQNCGKCVPDALGAELWAYTHCPTANPTSPMYPSGSSSGSTECRDPPEKPTSPTESASRPTKRRFSQADSSATHLDQQRRVKQSLEVRKVPLNPPKTTNNPGKRSSVQQQPLQQLLPRIQLPPQTTPLPRIPYQPAYAVPRAGVQHAPPHQLASPFSAPQYLNVSRVYPPQRDGFFVALQYQNAGAVPHHPVMHHAVPGPEHPPFHTYHPAVPHHHQDMPRQYIQQHGAVPRQPVMHHAVPVPQHPPFHAYDAAAPHHHQDMPRQYPQQQWRAPWNVAWPAPPTLPRAFSPARGNVSAFDPVRDSAAHNARNSAEELAQYNPFDPAWHARNT